MLPDWCTVVRADNPGPMTLDGTNTYVFTTASGTVVIDPGPVIDAHLARVMDHGPVILTVLTHHHLDHTESAVRFHELTGAPVMARDPELCLGAAPLDRDDVTLDVPDIRFQVLHTPGHTADSICLEVRRDDWCGLVSGDTVLGRGTTVVAHPDGRLGDYLDSLTRLRSRIDNRWTLLPAHGPVREHAADVVDQYLAHRRDRLAEVRAALDAGAASARDVVEIVYADVDRSVWPAAERTVEAALEYLGDTGKAPGGEA